jgi:hypothetical protein
LRIRGGKFEVLECIARDPFEVLAMQGAGLALEESAFEEFQAHGFVGIIVREFFDESADLDFDSEFFQDFASQTGFERFATFNLAAREFPKIREMIGGPALGDQEFSVPEDQGGSHVDDFHCGNFAERIDKSEKAGTRA